MNCQKIQETLSEYIDDELDASQKLSVKMHIMGCDSCRKEYEKLMRGWSALDLLESSTAPDIIRTRVLGSIRSEKRRKWLAVALPVAAMFLIVFGSLFLQPDMHDQQQMPAVRQSANVTQQSGEDKDIDEEDLIANLHILQEKDFYDILDILKQVDYLPLIDDSDARGIENGHLSSGVILT